MLKKKDLRTKEVFVDFNNDDRKFLKITSLSKHCARGKFYNSDYRPTTGYKYITYDELASLHRLTPYKACIIRHYLWPKRDASRIKDLYVFEVCLTNNDKIYKIGTSSTSADRVEGIMCKWPFDFNLLLNAPVKRPYQKERYLHNKFNHKNIKGEWFDLDQNDLKELKEYFSATKIFVQ